MIKIQLSFTFIPKMLSDKEKYQKICDETKNYVLAGRLKKDILSFFDKNETTSYKNIFCCKNTSDDKKEIEIIISFVSRNDILYHLFAAHLFGIIDEKEFKKTFDYFNFDFVKYRYNYTKQRYDVLECKNVNFQ